MIVNAEGVVLSRRRAAENDRLAVVFTEDLGKLLVRFAGVSKAQSKLKALSEPVVWGEYRLYLNPRTDSVKALGGRIQRTFPKIRSDFRRTVAALGFCELLDALSAPANPNPAKYRLLLSALDELDGEDHSPWLAAAYGLKLLDLAGLKTPSEALSGIAADAWEALHSCPFKTLGMLPWDEPVSRRLIALIAGSAEAQSGRELKTRLFADSLSRAVLAAPSLVL